MEQETPRRPRRRSKKEQFMRRYMPTFQLLGGVILVIAIIIAAVLIIPKLGKEEKQSNIKKQTESTTASTSASSSTSADTSAPPPDEPQQSTTQSEPADPETPPPPVTEPEPPVVYDPSYDFAAHAVDDSWYDDVLFIGDSRTEGLRLYARSGNADYFSSVGMSVFNYGDRVCGDTDFAPQTLHTLLSARTYGKIFISLGINEAGYPVDSFVTSYSGIIDLIHKYQPDAIIIIQGIMTVSRNYAANGSYFSPSNIQKFNDRLEQLADGEKIFYIDVNEFFTDEDGYLLSYVSGDGCHLSSEYTIVWKNWIGYAVKKLGL